MQKMKWFRSLACMPLGSAFVHRPALPPEETRHCTHAELRGLPLHQLPTLPWAPGVGPFGGLRPFGAFTPILAPVLQYTKRPADLVAIMPKAAEHSSRGLQPAKARRLGAATEMDEKKGRMLRVWLSFVTQAFPHSPLSSELLDSDDSLQSLGHTLYGSSGATLSQRYSGIKSYFDYTAHAKDDSGSYRVTEEELYSFAAKWHRHATTVSSTVSGLKFLGGLLESEHILKVAS